MKPYSPFKEFRILVDERVAMRDGVHLATTVYLPLADGPFPTVLVRMAYDRRVLLGAARQFTNRGLALVVQDTRGRYGSEGKYYPFDSEENDGLDTLDWLEEQPWCNGRVGMYGDSYLAAVQLAVASSNHPLLKALNPRFMAGDCWRHAYYWDGVFTLGLCFSWLVLEVNSTVSDAQMMPFYDLEALLTHLPLGTLDEFMGTRPSPAFRNVLEHSLPDEHWNAWRWRNSLEKTTVPLLLTGGWFDYYAGETFLNYEKACSSGDAEAAAGHRVIIGPWTHGVWGMPQMGDLDFGPEATGEAEHHIRWLECLLKGGTSKDFQEAPIRIFVMGDNRWRDEWEWPLARTQYTPFYLHGNGAGHAGTLSLEQSAEDTLDSYTYDPVNPVPTTGGNHSIGPYNPGLFEMCRVGPCDQVRVEERADVLTYTSAPLEKDTEVTGPVTLKLYASSSAVDTDWVGRLCDVYPDGNSFNVTEGVIRAAFREQDWENPTPIEPGHVYEYTIELHPTSNVFKAGHRFRLQITSSNFPLWARNLNTGEPIATATRIEIAEQTIYHDGQHPSHIVLPLIPRGK